MKMSMRKIIKADYFNRSSVSVAHDLIGCFLVKIDKKSKRVHRSRITETEAYEGPKDLASHASHGKTKRNSVMFESAGIFYVYLVYGMYWMLNIVTGKKDYPAAVLIRGVDGYNGPGRVTRALDITGEFNGKATNKETGLWFEYDNSSYSFPIMRTPRIGVGYSGPVWSKKPYRFILKGECNRIF